MNTTNYSISPANQTLFEEAKAQYFKDKEQFGEDIARALLKTKRYSDRGEAYRSEKEEVNHNRNQTKREIAKFDADEQAFEKEYQEKKSQLEAKRADINAKREALGLTTNQESTIKVSGYDALHPANNVPIDPDMNEGKLLDEGYLLFDNKKLPVFRNQAIAKAFDEMGVEVKEAKDTKEATVYLKELFKDYKDQFPQAFKQNDWFKNRDRTKFDLFEQWRKDNNLDFAGYQDSVGGHSRSGKELYSWLPVRIGSEFASLWSDRGHQKAKCNYGYESDALPVFAW